MIRSDVEPFIGLFSSLAALSQIKVEVWNETRPVFSSTSRPQEISVAGEARDFSARVRRRGTFQHAVFGDQQHVFGIPVSNGQQSIGALIAYPANAVRGSYCTTFDERQESGDEVMERLLGHLAGLIEQHCSSQAEIESLASELSQSP